MYVHHIPAKLAQFLLKEDQHFVCNGAESEAAN